MMSRKSNLALIGVLVMAVLLAIPAGAGSATRTSSTQKVYKNEYCKGPVYKGFPKTWGCTTITVPSQVIAGDTATVTESFTAKRKLRYLIVCFSTIGTGACAYKHKYAIIKRGQTIKRVLQLSAPSTPGDYGLDNLTRPYKKWEYTQVGFTGWRRAYWTTGTAAIHVVSAS